MARGEEALLISLTIFDPVLVPLLGIIGYQTLINLMVSLGGKDVRIPSLISLTQAIILVRAALARRDDPNLTVSSAAAQFNISPHKIRLFERMLVDQGWTL